MSIIRSICEVMPWCSLFIPTGRYIVIDVVKPTSGKGVFYYILAAFSVFLGGKLIQVKMSLYKLMDLDHFTTEEKYQI